MSESLAAELGRTAARFAGRPAVVDPERSLTYAELDARSDEVADRLRRLGAGPGSRIGILRRKDVDTVAYLFGILKAGCAYVPIDAKMGLDRMAVVLGDAGLTALVVEEATAPRLRGLAEGGLAFRPTDVDGRGEILEPVAASGGGAGSRPEPSDPDLAYVLYTSGSTGVPKGVQHTHRSALAFARWAADEFEVTEADRLSCHAPLHFDLTTFDLFAAVLAGACIVLIPGALALFPGRVAAWVEEQGITVWYSVPFALIQLLDRGSLETRDLALRQVIFAGERFPTAPLRRLAATLPAVRLANLFGPTETNVCTFHHLSPDDVASDEPCPIGRPCPYSVVELVDEGGDRVADGEIGELLVGGASVMSGYLNRPRLNREVFVRRQIDGASRRFFRTGDLVSVPADGAMRFHGRRDRQVKVRGFRIELDEIESALARCGGVSAAGVWVERDGEGLAEVRAAVAQEASQPPPTSERLIVEIRSLLPAAAIPSRVSVLERLPRTVNGKTDYAALARLCGEP